MFDYFSPNSVCRMVAVLICYLFHCSLQKAVDAKGGDMINSRVTFPTETHPKPIGGEFRTDVAESSAPLLQLCMRGRRLKRNVGGAEHFSARAHEAVKRDRREREKLMHGIADPLTKLSLCTHCGAASTTRSVREREDAVGRRARACLTRRTRLCKAGHVRRLFTRSFSLGKT